jgi:hypothetical protein
MESRNGDVMRITLGIGEANGFRTVCELNQLVRRKSKKAIMSARAKRGWVTRRAAEAARLAEQMKEE